MLKRFFVQQWEMDGTENSTETSTETWNPKILHELLSFKLRRASRKWKECVSEMRMSKRRKEIERVNINKSDAKRERVGE